MKKHLCFVILTLSACANAQWTVVSIENYINGVHSGQQVGELNGTTAVMWTGTAGSMINLTPAGGGHSAAYAVADLQQVGWAEVGAASRASLWSGTAASWVDLHPAGVTWSRAFGIGDGQQVGAVIMNDDRRASLWEGTAASWINLDPVHAGSLRSYAFGASAGTQVGYAHVGGIDRASLWTGTAASWVDLTPSGFPTGSAAYAVHGIHQVGAVDLGGISRASLWTGTAASWVDLHPVGADYSQAYGVSFDRQVGRTDVAGESQASIWTSTATSRVNLHAYLPPGNTSSRASAIWTDVATGTTYVVGNNWMWVSKTVVPASYSMFRGSVFSGNLASLLLSDGNKLVLRPGVTLGTSQPPIQIILNATAPTSSPNGFSFSVESNASFGNAQQKVSLYNFSTGLYEELDTRLAKTSDETVAVNVTNNTARFIQAGTLAIRARVSFRAVGPSLAFPWSGRIDKVWWNFPG